jgi:hypothetical protein
MVFMFKVCAQVTASATKKTQVLLWSFSLPLVSFNDGRFRNIHS